FFTEPRQCFITIGNCAAITPNDCRTQHLLSLINQYKAVHLIGNSDGLYLARIETTFGKQTRAPLLDAIPPDFGVLLCPASLWTLDRQLGFRLGNRPKAFATLSVYDGKLDR